MLHGRVFGAPLVALGLAIAALVAFATGARAHDRTALVIANFDYGEHRLPRAQAEAAAVAEALRGEGFAVAVAENLPVKELKPRVERFAKETRVAGAAVLYFAGLGGQYVSYNSQGAAWNHLQGAGKPADAKSPERDSLAVPELLKVFAEHSAARVNWLVFDAARENPFLAQRQNQPVGFAATAPRELADDMVALWAAAPGAVAGDAASASPLAAAFVKRLPLARASLGQALEAIARDVAEQTAGKQQPTHVAGAAELPSAGWPRAAAAVLASAEPKEGSRAGEHWVNGLGMTFCWCPPGKFVMGAASAGRASADPSTSDRPEFADARPVEVTLTRGFWMAKYEASQIEGQRAGWTPLLSLTKHKLAPMHNLSHENPRKVLELLNKLEKQAGRLPDGWEYQMPTEAQWEYACRAGATTRFSFGDDEGQLHLHANHADKSLLADDAAVGYASARFDDGVGRRLALVGRYPPNAWGLHDLHGNVAEWVADRYAPALPGGVDPLVKDSKSGDGVIRGGAWCSAPDYCQSAFRNSEFSGKSRDFIGFRVILSKK